MHATCEEEIQPLGNLWNSVHESHPFRDAASDHHDDDGGRADRRRRAGHRSACAIDIFPPFDLPQIYVIQNYNGMSPAQMEGLIVNQFELNFQYVDGVKNVESQSIQQIALIKLSFYPGTDMAQAMAEVVAQANRAQASMPPGVLPPQIMRMDAGSVPIGYLVLTGKGESLGTLADLAQQRIRPLLQSNVPGTVGTAPFGSNVRSIVINVDPDRLRSYNLTPEDVVKALTTGNVIVPAGNLYIKDQMPLVPTNAMVAEHPGDSARSRVQPGRNVYIGDVATVADSHRRQLRLRHGGRAGARSTSRSSRRTPPRR